MTRTWYKLSRSRCYHRKNFKKRIIQIKIVTVLIHVLLHLFKYYVKMFLYQFNHLITKKKWRKYLFVLQMFIHIFINFLLFFFSECDRKQPVTYLSDVWNYFITNPELITLTQYICKDKVINFFWLPKLIPYKDYCYEWKREPFDSAIKSEARLWSYWCSVFVLTLCLGDD